ncbi:hypothetical protein T310_8998, partial [Rasamsonia emersonii CBS 393.64]
IVMQVAICLDTACTKNAKSGCSVIAASLHLSVTITSYEMIVNRLNLGCSGVRYTTCSVIRSSQLSLPSGIKICSGRIKALSITTTKTWSEYLSASSAYDSTPYRLDNYPSQV